MISTSLSLNQALFIHKTMPPPLTQLESLTGRVNTAVEKIVRLTIGEAERSSRDSLHHKESRVIRIDRMSAMSFSTKPPEFAMTIPRIKPRTKAQKLNPQSHTTDKWADTLNEGKGSKKTRKH
ncbi:hypothetical protein UFOVP861_10 [uncultured Caudovirales phage]|uniref:Uncharacterized protein n=1 Tax=uncultured Caudovirales phage TaxID=2100421 RepID=A0A6J5PDD4_9CAUD|nr:hypothetical protein UFOVP861_10 [uncultured Caudovirales phage]